MIVLEKEKPLLDSAKGLPLSFFRSLGDRLRVGHQILALRVRVRILLPQPFLRETTHLNLQVKPFDQTEAPDVSSSHLRP